MSGDTRDALVTDSSDEDERTDSPMLTEGTDESIHATTSLDDPELLSIESDESPFCDTPSEVSPMEIDNHSDVAVPISELPNISSSQAFQLDPQNTEQGDHSESVVRSLVINTRCVRDSTVSGTVGVSSSSSLGTPDVTDRNVHQPLSVTETQQELKNTGARPKKRPLMADESNRSPESRPSPAKRSDVSIPINTHENIEDLPHSASSTETRIAEASPKPSELHFNEYIKEQFSDMSVQDSFTDFFRSITTDVAAEVEVTSSAESVTRQPSPESTQQETSTRQTLLRPTEPESSTSWQYRSPTRRENRHNRERFESFVQKAIQDIEGHARELVRQRHFWLNDFPGVPPYLSDEEDEPGACSNDNRPYNRPFLHEEASELVDQLMNVIPNILSITKDVLRCLRVRKSVTELEFYLKIFRDQLLSVLNIVYRLQLRLSQLEKDSKGYEPCETSALIIRNSSSEINTCIQRMISLISKIDGELKSL